MLLVNMILFTLLSALFLCASVSTSKTGVSHWWSEPTARPSIDASKCSDYYSLFEQCRTIPHGFGPATQTSTMAVDMMKNCSMLAQTWGSIIKSCGGYDKSGLPTSFSHRGPTASPVASPTAEVRALDARKKKKPKPTCNIEGDSPFETCDSEKRDDMDSIEHESESAMAKRDQRCPQDYHFLTAEHDTYDYYFCCPIALNKILLPESYAAAPKCCRKSDKTCDLDAVDSLDGCRDPGSEVTQYGGVIGCRNLATKKDKRQASPDKTGITAGHDPVTSLGPDSDLHPTTYPVAPPDHGQYCHHGGCGKGHVTSYVDGIFCQCVPAPPPTPSTVTVHDPVTGFIRDVVGRNAERTETIWLPNSPQPKKTGTITVTITVPAPTTMQTSTKQDSIKALGKQRTPAFVCDFANHIQM